MTTIIRVDEGGLRDYDQLEDLECELKKLGNLSTYGDVDFKLEFPKAKKEEIQKTLLLLSCSYPIDF